METGVGKSKGSEMDQKWIQEWETRRLERDRLIQREMFFREELAQREEQQDWKKGDAWNVLNQSLTLNTQDLWRCQQAMKTLYDEKAHTGPSVHEWWKKQHNLQREAELQGREDREQEKYQRTAILKCAAGGGCCARGCKCCEKRRRTADGTSDQIYDVLACSYNPKSHCTEDCGCCRRHWRLNSIAMQNQADGNALNVDGPVLV